MLVRSITPREFQAFVAFSADAARNQRFADYLQRLFISGACRPEWCFVAEVEGDVVGRLSFWAPPGEDVPSVIDFLDVPRGNSHLLDALLAGSATTLGLGGEAIGISVDDPSPIYPTPEQTLALLRSAGRLVRKTARFRWEQSEAPTLPSRLSFRPLRDVGAGEFRRALGKVMEGTRDRALQEDLIMVGADGHWERLQRFEYDPSWYCLAFGATGDLVGLTAPARNADGHAIIAFIGVVPSRRGHRYVDDLLVQATRTLLAAGEKTVLGDADVENDPMVAAFARVGYRNFAHRFEFELPLLVWS